MSIEREGDLGSLACLFVMGLVVSWSNANKAFHLLPCNEKMSSSGALCVTYDTPASLPGACGDSTLASTTWSVVLLMDRSAHESVSTVIIEKFWQVRGVAPVQSGPSFHPAL